MADDDKTETAIRRGDEAARLLAHPLLNEAFDKLESAYVETWKQTRYDDTDARDRLWQAVNCIGKLREQLQLVVSNGKVAKRHLEDMQGTGNRVR